MTRQQFLKTIRTGAVFGAVVLGGMILSSGPGLAADDDESKIQQGFAIAPVPLNLAGKDPALVGLGSYIVNAQADCNGCHTSAPLDKPWL